jgi:hypothetical protein
VEDRWLRKLQAKEGPDKGILADHLLVTQGLSDGRGGGL